MDLQKFRHDYKLSQRGLADILGCKQSNISSMENSEKPLSTLNVKILIEKFGFDAISKYLTAEELPASSVVNVDINKTEIKGNTAPVQNGDNNQMSADATLVQVLKQQSDQNSALLAELSKRSEQMDRLITLLEKK